jgi:transketolase
MQKDLLSTREGFGRALLKIGEKDKNVYVLSADLRDSLKVADFAEAFPDQFIECGVAEQNMVGIAAGLAAEGKIPFTTSFGVFSPSRTFDQIRVSVCLSNLPVKIVGGHGGLSNYKDGASHQSLEDIAITRVLPRMRVFIPADFNQAIQVTLASYKDKHPNYIRLSGENTPNFIHKDLAFKVGQAQVLDEGEDVIIISYGPMLYHVINAVKQAKIKATIINMHTIKPLDKSAVLESLEISKKIVVVEDHQIIGGLGSSVAEVLAQSGIKHRLKLIGVRNRFGKSARNIEDLYKYMGLDEENLAKKIREFVVS